VALLQNVIQQGFGILKSRSRKTHLLLMLALLPLAVSAQDLANIPGMFIDIGFGARPMGMGGAFTALANDANAVLLNPAGLGSLQAQYASFFYCKQFALIPYTLTVYAKGFTDKNWAHSEALIVSGDDALRETTLLFGAGYKLASIIPGLQLGATLKYKNATFGNNKEGGAGQVRGSAVGFGMDLGAIYPVQEKVAIGLVLKDVFDFISWNSTASGIYTEGSPMRMIGGVAFTPRNDFIITLDLDKSLHRDTQDRLHIGSEKRFFNLFSLRAGAFQSMLAAAAMNYNAGFGCQYTAFNNMTFYLDLAYVMQEIENSVRVSCTVGF